MVPPASPVNPKPRVPLDLLLVGGALLAVHLGVRNHTLTPLNGGIEALDGGYLMEALARVAGGERAYTPVVFHYGPYWVGYYVGMMKLFGVSVGGVRWGVALLAWLRSVTTYALTARLAGRWWGLVAVAVTIVSPNVLLGAPYGSYTSGSVLLVFAGAVLWALAAEGSARRWLLVGLLIGVMFGARWSSAFIALAATGIVGGATGLLHPPVRRGHLVGTVVIPGLLLVSVGLLVWPYARASWIAFGPPAVGAAVLAGAESWRRRGTGPATWREWRAAPAWCAAGIGTATLVWLVPMTLAGDVATRVHDMFLRYAASVQVGRWYAVEQPPGLEALGLVTHTPPAPLMLAGWGLLLFGWVVHARRGDGARWRLTCLAWAAAGVMLTVSMVRAHAFQSARLGDLLWAELLGPVYLVWCLHHAFRAGDARPPWLVPLACLAGVTFLDGAADVNWVHVGAATGVAIVFGVVAAHQAWLAGRTATRLLGPALAVGVAPLIAAQFLLGAGLWWTLPGDSWRFTRRDLAWVDVPRGQVWEDVGVAREIRANVLFLQAALPPDEPCFSFPDALYLFLADRRGTADVTYFWPGYSAPHIDGHYASYLRTDPPRLVVTRYSPLDVFGGPLYLARGFPKIVDTLDDEFRVVQEIGILRYYAPRRRGGR